jgi:hypothetical protein
MDNEILILAFLALVIAGIAFLVGANYGAADEAAIQARLMNLNLPRCHEVNITSDLETLGLDVSILRRVDWAQICQEQLRAKGPVAVENCTEYAKSVGLDLGAT